MPPLPMLGHVSSFMHVRLHRLPASHRSVHDVALMECLAYVEEVVVPLYVRLVVVVLHQHSDMRRKRIGQW